MGSELKALERVERSGEKPNETQKAFQTEYLKLVQNREPLQNQDGDQAIIIGDPSDKATDKTEKAAKREGPESAIDHLAKATEEYMKSGTLTPELRKTFEGVVAEADKETSPRIPVLEKKLQGLADEAKVYFTPEKQAEAKDLQKQLNELTENLTDDQRQSLAVMMLMRAFTEPGSEERKEVDGVIEQTAPGLMEKSGKLEAVLKPVREKMEEGMAVQQEIDLEKKAPVMSRVVFAEVLLDSGDEKGAQKLIREAAVKDQTLLDSEYFVDLAQRAGLDRKQLMVYKA